MYMVGVFEKRIMRRNRTGSAVRMEFEMNRFEINIFEKEEALEAVLSDASNLLEDLYQSGFDTVHDSTLEALNNMGRRAAAYGMELLSGLLMQLTDALRMRRHQMDKGADSLMHVYIMLNQYMEICREKIERDKGIRYYVL